jgi:thiol-disulfide isomerase/thioredoxin
LKYLIFISLLAVQLSPEKQVNVYGSFDAFKADHLENLNSDTTYIYNFWATWCKPCIAELPYFERYNKENQGKPVKMVLVSLDFKDKVETAVKPFIERKKIRSEVVVLADGKASEWIDRVDSSWSGAIPATLVLKGDKKLFFEKSYETYEDLTSDLLKINENE